MKIIKRDGTEVGFDAAKIVTAVTKANNRVEAAHKLSEADAVCPKSRTDLQGVN